MMARRLLRPESDLLEAERRHLGQANLDDRKAVARDRFPAVRNGLSLGFPGLPCRPEKPAHRPRRATGKGIRFCNLGNIIAMASVEGQGMQIPWSFPGQGIGGRRLQRSTGGAKRLVLLNYRAPFAGA